MAGILRKKLAEYKKAIKDGDKEKAKKLEGTLLKYSKTLSEKYLKDKG